MSDDKEKKLKEREKAFDLVYGIVLGFVVIVVGFYMYHFRSYYVSLDPDDWGTFGDFMGGTLNPLLAFFSFMLLLLNLKLQREQLDKTEEQLELNREELGLTRDELRKAADAQVDSAKVMNEQLKTQYLQQFDGFFSNFLTRFSQKLEFLMDGGRIKKVHGDIFNRKTRKNHFGRQFLLQEHQEVMILLNMLFELLSNIDQASIDIGQKKKYVNVVKSSLPRDVLDLLMVLGQEMPFGRDFCEFREIIERYALLENIKFYDGNIFKTSMLLTMSQKYNESAFGENINFKKFQKSIFYQDFEKCENFLVILYRRLLECKYVSKIDSQQQKYLLINEGDQALDKFVFGVDDIKNLVDVTTVIYITSGYLHSMEITDFRLEKNIIHLKAQGQWQTAICFKGEKLVRFSSSIVDEVYFDHCFRSDD